MSKSVPLCKPIRTITKDEIANTISDRTKVSAHTIKTVLDEYATLITEELINGNAILFSNVCTFHLRRRDYSEKRRREFHLTAKATLPEFCYYPYANMSMPFRQKIAKVKHQISETHKQHANETKEDTGTR